MTPDDDLAPTFVATLAVVALAVALAALVWWCGQRDEAGIAQAEISPATTAGAVDRVETPEDDAGPSSSGENDMAWIGWRADLWAGVLAAAPDPEVEVSSMAIERQPSGEVVVTNPPEAPVAPGELADLICSYDWPCRQWTEIVRCESTFNPHAVGSAGERGLTQVHPVHRPRIEAMGFTWDDMFDPRANLDVAYSIWSEQGTRPWSCAR